MALTDAQVDTLIAQRIAAYEERIVVAQTTIIGLGVEMAAATDSDARRSYAQQIIAQQQDVTTLTALISEFTKIAGEAESGKKVRNTSQDVVTAATALLAG